jgi:signal transduction histidine kinase
VQLGFGRHIRSAGEVASSSILGGVRIPAFPRWMPAVVYCGVRKFDVAYRRIRAASLQGSFGMSDPHHLPHTADSGGLFQSAINWFSGDGQYMNLVHCMGQDYLWISITVALDFAVAAGYLLIAKHWWTNERTLPDSPARRALAAMRNIFLFCGICGYLFIPIKMIWPAWRLYDLFMVALVYFTWRYAWGAKDLKVIYAELGKSTRLAEELEATREESHRKTFFLNAVSHDLRTPLNGLVLQASLADMSAESGDREGMRQASADMKSSARTASELLDSLLEYARLDWISEPHHVSEFRLKDLVVESMELHRVTADGRGLWLKCNCTEDLVISTDRQKLQRVLSNLIANGLKFTTTGGVRVEVEHANSAVEIHVVDTGVGINAADRDRLFEEFFQVHNHERDRRKGFGLGLAIARRLARQLGGDIAVESTPAHGSRFTVALPGIGAGVNRVVAGPVGRTVAVGSS